MCGNAERVERGQVNMQGILITKIIIKIIVIRVILWGLGFNWMTLLTWKAKKDFQGITMIESLSIILEMREVLILESNRSRGI